MFGVGSGVLFCLKGVLLDSKMGNIPLPAIILLLHCTTITFATFSVNPNSNVIVKEATDSVLVVIPGSTKDFEIYNMGKVPLFAEAVYGIPFKWLGTINSVTVNPGERKTVPVGNKSFYKTGLKVTNNDANWRGIFHADRKPATYSGVTNSGKDYPIPAVLPDIDKNKIFKGVVAFGAKQIPAVGSAISNLVTTFWPDKKKNVWNQIKDKVQSLVDQSAIQTIETVLNADIKQYKDRVSVLASELNDTRRSDVSSHYMEIAHNMIGLEKKFIVGSDRPNYKRINYHLLPLYSNVVTMKLGFYVLGLRRATDIGLSEDNLHHIKNYMTTLVRGEDGANQYIDEIYNEQVLDVYNTADAPYIFNSLMAMRTYITVNGLEYVTIWKQLLDHPESYEIPYNDPISYSNFFGRTSADLNKEAVPDRQNLLPPLTPKLISGRRNRITKIHILHWRIRAQGINNYGPTKIGGLYVFFENGESYKLGSSLHYGTAPDGVLELNGATITKMKVGGNGAVDFLRFYLSDGREEFFGYAGDNRGIETDFELKDHHIVGFYLANDITSLQGQAANIAVSYQLNDNVGKM